MVTQDGNRVKIPKSTTMFYVLLTLGLACANAIVFPIWTGYPGGVYPLPPGMEGILPTLVILVVNLGSLVLLKACSLEQRLKVRYLLFLAAFTRIAYLVARNWKGANVVDVDVEIFFNYAREFVSGNYPSMEYPQGGLLFFAGVYQLAAGSFGRFRTLFPLMTLLFDLFIIGSLLWLGKRYLNERTAAALSLFYAVSPFTLVMWYGKYDMVPAGLLALGVCLFLANRYTLSALVLAAGSLAKWFPGIAIAFILIYFLRVREYRAAFKYAVIAGVAILLPLALFWWVSPEKVIYTYAFQSGRSLMGESLLYLPVYFLDPGARLVSDPPWYTVETDLISNSAAMLILIAGEMLLLIGSALLRARKETTVTFAGLGVAAFILLNRVFSPQFIIVLIVAYALGFVLLSTPRMGALVLAPILLVLTFMNYLIWPLWSDEWFVSSVLFFALNLAIVGWIVYRSVWLSSPDQPPALAN
jgi:hypothetical protein